MMKVTRAAAGILATVALAACYPVTVRTDYDPGAPFAELQTYQWVDSQQDGAGAPAVNNPLVGQRVRDAVDRALAERGFRKASGDNVDFNLSYRLVTVETIEERGPYGGYYPYDGYYYGRGLYWSRFYGWHGFYNRGFYYGPYGYGAFAPYYRTVERLESTLILDITDAATGALVWRGWAEKNLNDNPKPDEVQEYVEQAVEKMLAEFPPADFHGIADR